MLKKIFPLIVPAVIATSMPASNAMANDWLDEHALGMTMVSIGTTIAPALVLTCAIPG